MSIGEWMTGGAVETTGATFTRGLRFPRAAQNEPGLEYELTGHKWFTSAPMCDGFLTLAQTPNGITCFLVPRWMPNGQRNAGFRVQRLKDKLGDHANASSEVWEPRANGLARGFCLLMAGPWVSQWHCTCACLLLTSSARPAMQIEYDRAWAQRIGAEGQGIKTIMDMVSHTRLDCTLGSAALMHQSVLYAIHHGTQRRAFGARLADQPLMQVRGTLTATTRASVARTTL
jgi:putative acyl-CoA dehydrogenase